MNKKRIVLILIVAFFVGLAVYNLDFNQLYSPDSAEFSILAKAILSGSYNDISMPQNPSHTKYPFGYPLLLTPAAALSSDHFVYILLCKLTTVLLGALAFVGIYFLFEKNLLISVLTAFTPVFFLFSTNVMSEVPLLCFSVWGLFFLKQLVESEKLKSGNFATLLLFSFLMGFISAFAYFVRGNGITLLPTVMLYILLYRSIPFRKRLIVCLLSFVFTFALVLPWVLRDIHLSKTARTSGENYVSQILTPFENPFKQKLDAELLAKRIRFNLAYYSKVLIAHIFPSFNPAYSGVENYTVLPLLLVGKASLFAWIFLAALLVLGIYFHIKEKGVDLFVLFPAFFAGLLIIFTYRQHRYFLPLIPFSWYFLLKGIEGVGKILGRKLSRLFLYPGRAIVTLILALNLFSCFIMAASKGESYMPMLAGWIETVTGKGDVIMAYPYIYVLTGRKCIPFDPKSVSVPSFEFTLIQGKVKYIIAEAWFDDVTEFDTLLFSSRLFEFKKLVQIGNNVVYKVKELDKKEKRKRIAEEDVDYSSIIQHYESLYPYGNYNPYFHNTLGYFYYKAEKYDKAIDEFKKAVLLAPDDHILHFNLGTAYLNAGQYSLALDEYEIVRKCEFGYTLQHVLNKNIEIATIKQNIAVDPAQSGTPYNYLEVAKLWFERGSYKKAKAELEQALKLDPNFYEGKLLLGMCYEAMFKYDKAKKIYKELLKKNPHNHLLEEKLKNFPKI